ncbi:MAG TPA: hypothetical protein VKZ68_08355 [Ohtaekwangia sp.]|nr:hypothetical protein [Ohtaekwangia sp.]
MKPWAISLLVCIALTAHGQSATTRFLTYEQNQSWLTTTKAVSKSAQWAAIKNRFFTKENQNSPIDSMRSSPILVINGVPVDLLENLAEKKNKELLSLLNNNTINEIVILDKLAEHWTFCKPFAGVILLRVDRKTERKLRKFNVE